MLSGADDPLLAALLAGDLDRADACLAADPRLRGRVTVERVDNARTAPAAPVWRVERDGRSRFRFHPGAWGDAADVILGRWCHMLPLVAAVLDAAPPPGWVSFNLGDEGHRPGLAFCDHRAGATLVPDPVFLMTDGYGEIAARFAARALPLAERRAAVFWRGTTTGPAGADAATLPRLRLCRLARTLGDAADMGVSSVTAGFRDAGPALAAEGLVRDYVPIHDLDLYRVHVDIDGNSNSWPGLFAKLLSGSPVLKVASERGFRQWYYDRLEPWGHYVPVRADLSDFAVKAALLLAEPTLAARIGAAGRALARSMTVAGEIARTLPAVLAAFAPLDAAQ